MSGISSLTKTRMTNLKTSMPTDTSQVQNSSVPALDPKYVRRLVPDPGGGYTATIHELPGCIAEGDTAEEALAHLNDIAHSWIESAKATGYPVSPPIDYEGASGKIALRISRRLHQLAAERADLEGTSLNQFIGNAVANYLGQQDGMRRIALQLESALSDSVHAAYVAIYSSRTRRETSFGRTVVGSANVLLHGSSSDASFYFAPTATFELPTPNHGQAR